MLAIFNRIVVETTDSEKNLHTGSINALKDGILVKLFKSVHPNALVYKFNSSALMAYSPDNNNHSMPWSLDSRGDIFCLFKGHIDNVDVIKNHKGWMKPASHATLIIEAYKCQISPPGLKDSLAVKSFTGDFAYVLYDAVAKRGIFGITGHTYELHRGYDSEGSMVVADDQKIVETACPNTCEAV